MRMFDQHDKSARDDSRTEDSVQPMYAALRSLEENGVDVTGSETPHELTQMKTAIDAFRRAAELLAGRTSPTPPDISAELCRQVVPPRAADETPRQYTERINRMSERFRSLTEGPGRSR